MTVIENRMQCGLDVKMQMYFLTFSLYACEREKSELFYFRLIMFFMEKKTLKRLFIFTHKLCTEDIKMVATNTICVMCSSCSSCLLSY